MIGGWGENLKAACRKLHLCDLLICSGMLFAVDKTLKTCVDKWTGSSNFEAQKIRSCGTCFFFLRCGGKTCMEWTVCAPGPSQMKEAFVFRGSHPG